MLYNVISITYTDIYKVTVRMILHTIKGIMLFTLLLRIQDAEKSRWFGGV